MKKVFYLFCILLAVFLHSNGQSLNDSINVLFIGNSITYFNSMPSTFKDIANNQNKKVSVSAYTPGGTGFVNHYNDPNVFNLFKLRTWNIVILQPGSGESPGASFPIDTTIKRGKILLDSLYKYNSCAKVFIYQIPYGIPSATDYNTYFSVQKMIIDSVYKLADSLNVQIIPAGKAFYSYYTQNQNLLLHSNYNDIHPNAFGSFLIASTAYVSIFQDSINDCTFYSNLYQDTVLRFFTIADSVVFENPQQWNINKYNIHSEFNYIPNGLTVQFFNNSTNYSHCFWEFGDNGTSTTSNPSHIFNQNGTYKIKLTVSHNGCTDSTTKYITLETISVNDFQPFDNLYQIYPNPVNDFLYINTDDTKSIYSINDMSGRVIKSGKFLNTCLKRIELSDLQSGLYLINIIKSNGTRFQSTFIKQ